MSLFLQVLNDNNFFIFFHFHVLNHYNSSFSVNLNRSERSENPAGKTEDGLDVNRTMQRLHSIPGRWWEHAQVHSQNSVRGSRRAWPSLLQSRRQTLYLLLRVPFRQLLIRFFILYTQFIILAFTRMTCSQKKQIKGFLLHVLCAEEDNVLRGEVEKEGHAWLQERDDKPDDLNVVGALYTGPKVED